MDVDKVGVTLTDQNFQTVVLESPQPVLVAFTAEGCGPWRLLAPELAALAEAFRGQVTFAMLDVGEYCLSNHVEGKYLFYTPVDPKPSKQGHRQVYHLLRL